MTYGATVVYKALQLLQRLVTFALSLTERLMHSMLVKLRQ